MSDKQTIEHIGFIDQVSGGKATVKINSVSACASCHARGACGAADQKEKILTVSTGGKLLSSGERVRVLIARRAGLHAVALGYVYPFFLLMLVLISCTIAGLGELQAGVFSLLSLIPYYLTIYLMKQKISQSFSFRLEKL